MEDTRTIMENKQDDSASTGYARLREELSKISASSSSKPHRQILIGSVLVILFTLCGLLGGIIALRVHLQLTSSSLDQTEGQVSAYKNVINNLTAILASNVNQHGRKPQSAFVSEPSVVYIHWGASSCPEPAEVIYEGVTASGSTNKSGGGSNYLCMTLNPDYLAPKGGRQGGRSYIYGAEYRNGHDYQPLNNIHGHDAPCAACRVRRRSTFLMIPGATTCPTKGNWTLEYYGYLMSSRTDFKRSEYICVDSFAESVPGSNDEFQDGAILFPVEAYCNNRANGGLPCSPYVDGFELTCAVCTV
ncbi:uncharacterized protein [Amphiura filiformis]|uniref:uncharacterized protein n=1 Tax=Amphiura filiformis TaxID=82378 RepID=UPI003B225ECB